MGRRKQMRLLICYNVVDPIDRQKVARLQLYPSRYIATDVARCAAKLEYSLYCVRVIPKVSITSIAIAAAAAADVSSHRHFDQIGTSP